MKHELLTPRFIISALLAVLATILALTKVISGEAWLAFAGVIAAGYGGAFAVSKIKS